MWNNNVVLNGHTHVQIPQCLTEVIPEIKASLSLTPIAAGDEL